MNGLRVYIVYKRRKVILIIKRLLDHHDLSNKTSDRGANKLRQKSNFPCD